MTSTQPKTQPAHYKTFTRRNDLSIQRIRQLHYRAEREKTGLYLMEGVRMLVQATRHTIPLEKILFCPEKMTLPISKPLIRQQEQAGTPCWRLSPEVYDSLTLAEEPQGVLAVARQQWQPLDRVRPGRGLCWLALEGIRSPGNLGTILRTAEAVGVGGIILMGDTADPYDPAAVRASMGALFAQPFVRTTAAEFAAWRRHHTVTLVGTSPSAPTDYQAISYPRPTLLLMGCERRGLSEEMQALCDLRVKIPMVGRCDSLNIGVATGVMLYELMRQHRERQTC